MSVFACYGMLAAAAMLFSSQFVFHQRFTRDTGNGASGAWYFKLLTSPVIALIAFCLAGFRVEFTWFTCALAVVSSVSGMLYVYFSVKSFQTVNLSVYSTFAMLGGMVLPFLTGVLFFGESLGGVKLLCMALLLAALYLPIRGQKRKPSDILYYLAVFVLNGMSGVLAKLHQELPFAHTDSYSYVFWGSLISTLLAALLLFGGKERCPRPRTGHFVLSAGYGVFNGVGNILLLLALTVLPASVQYPMVTGGVMVFSTLFCLLKKEKLTRGEIVSAVFAFAAALLMAF